MGNNPNIQINAYKVLGKILDSSDHKRFRRLKLSGNNITSTIVQVMTDDLQYNEYLKYLDFSHN